MDAGLSCRTLDLYACNVDALRAFISPQQTSLEILRVGRILHQPEHPAELPTQSLLKEHQFSNLMTLEIEGEYRWRHEDFLGELLVHVSRQLTHLQYEAGDRPLGPAERPIQELFKQCSFERLQVMECVNVEKDTLCAITASAHLLQNLYASDLH